METQIIDIFWNRIYLNIIFEGKDLEQKDIYLKSAKGSYKLEITKIENEKYKSQINITNIENGKMLENGDYAFVFKDNDEENYIKITTELGYKLEQLDKV